MRLEEDQIIDTRATREEADEACKKWAAIIAKLGMQNAWGVYVKPYRIPKRYKWWFAVVVSRQE
jgi:hypothetical protein